jgi:Protein of unknown function (DUF3551)
MSALGIAKLVDTKRCSAGEIAMRARACTILCIGAILIAAPAWAAGGRYDPDYPVCMEGITSDGTRLDCIYTSIEQCKQGTIGTSGTCFNNPGYVPRPAEAAPPASTEPEFPAKPKKNMGRYDPDYAVCMEGITSDGTRLDCIYTSIEQCKQGTIGTSGTCFNNPYYVPPPPEAATAPQTQPAPPVKPAKSPKSAKSAKSAKSLQSPPLPQPAQSQQR